MMQTLKDFIDRHRHTYGVEPGCKVWQIVPWGYRRHVASRGILQVRCARAKRDDKLKPEIERVWQTNLQVYGTDKVWRQINRE